MTWLKSQLGIQTKLSCQHQKSTRCLIVLGSRGAMSVSPPGKRLVPALLFPPRVNTETLPDVIWKMEWQDAPQGKLANADASSAGDSTNWIWQETLDCCGYGFVSKLWNSKMVDFPSSAKHMPINSRAQLRAWKPATLEIARRERRTRLGGGLCLFLDRLFDPKGKLREVSASFRALPRERDVERRRARLGSLPAPMNEVEISMPELMEATILHGWSGFFFCRGFETCQNGGGFCSEGPGSLSHQSNGVFQSFLSHVWHFAQ